MFPKKVEYRAGRHRFVIGDPPSIYVNFVEGKVTAKDQSGL